ncbi:tRNA 2-selenouridine(34) synthase MnmH [Sporosarcina thermotolerans]|uniref:tRNA 2-selenouridine(34) synthase MnmH n=1 Tax=Sporosarcina thermotolerans TaxID=633404 RepID=A0AAW9A3J3_9BACL|nr:tRNA 2-selenouridine(34) synthase MnmH [Sporosarcina thermotolerans]MDW0115367.1 tRNA 2-selenouridine(34) synthase MnmH [Sporosarcina thermotolerans]WHT47289.1 tRNA 2-selenouridine(34) synthase MnmH [Sporosarcina thermotolerans]
MFRDISIQDLLFIKEREPHTLIDVRSPSEYKEATIPGSINIPFFSDEERAEIGTLYKRVGKDAANERGLEIFSAKLPDFIRQFKTIETPMTVFCWRGGMRSKTAATVLDLMGINANRLSGGIRTYRQWVVKELEKEDFPPKLIVLNGYTGTGKTLLLQRLADEGHPVIDLEQFAGHRGSIFGQIGLEPNNQKKFDSLLVQQIQKVKQKPYVFIEGESKRIGKVLVPSYLFDKKENGIHVFIHLPIEERVHNILSDYNPWESQEQFIEAFRLIQRRIHVPIAKEIEESLNEGHFESAVKLLLEHYYDPRYEYSTTKRPHENNFVIHASSVDDAYDQLVKLNYTNEKLITK